MLSELVFRQFKDLIVEKNDGWEKKEERERNKSKRREKERERNKGKR